MLTVILAVFVSLVSGGITGNVAAQDTQQPGLNFDFSDAPWQAVVEWFSAESGYMLEPVDQWPEGTFTLQSDGPVSPMKAIDEINHKLRLSEPPKTLLRNGRKLYLVDATRDLPDELVETIPVGQLDSRGKYEPLQVIFDVDAKNMDQIRETILETISPIDEPHLNVLMASNQICLHA